MKTLGIHEFLPSNWLMEWLASEVVINDNINMMQIMALIVPVILK